MLPHYIPSMNVSRRFSFLCCDYPAVVEFDHDCVEVNWVGSTDEKNRDSTSASFSNTPILINVQDNTITFP